MAHFGVCADLPFGYQEIEPAQRPRGMGFRRLEEQATHAHVANLRDIFAAAAFPVHPDIPKSLYS